LQFYSFDEAIKSLIVTRGLAFDLEEAAYCKALIKQLNGESVPGIALDMQNDVAMEPTETGSQGVPEEELDEISSDVHSEDTPATK